MTADKLPGELRQAAKDIAAVAQAAPCYSMINTIVQNTVNHICAVARTIELRNELEVLNAAKVAAPPRPLPSKPFVKG